MAKKFTIEELKVSSCVTSLERNEQDKAKGGHIYIPGNTVGVNGGKEGWTGIKTQVVIRDGLIG